MNRRTGFCDYSYLNTSRFRQPKLEIAARTLVREVGEHELRSANIVAGSLQGHAGFPIERKQRLRAERTSNRSENRALGVGGADRQQRCHPVENVKLSVVQPFEISNLREPQLAKQDRHDAEKQNRSDSDPAKFGGDDTPLDDGRYTDEDSNTNRVVP